MFWSEIRSPCIFRLGASWRSGTRTSRRITSSWAARSRWRRSQRWSRCSQLDSYGLVICLLRIRNYISHGDTHSLTREFASNVQTYAFRDGISHEHRSSSRRPFSKRRRRASPWRIRRRSLRGARACQGVFRGQLSCPCSTRFCDAWQERAAHAACHLRLWERMVWVQGLLWKCCGGQLGYLVLQVVKRDQGRSVGKGASEICATYRVSFGGAF